MPKKAKVLPSEAGYNLAADFYDEKEKSVFTGDTLFAQAIGRTDLPGGDYKQLMKNIREKLLSLPEETKVFPGHGPASTVGGEKRNF